MRLIPRVNTRVNNMRLAEQRGQHIMDMRRQILETSLGAHEAMDINQQQAALLGARAIGQGRRQRQARARAIGAIADVARHGIEDVEWVSLHRERCHDKTGLGFGHSHDAPGGSTLHGPFATADINLDA